MNLTPINRPEYLDPYGWNYLDFSIAMSQAQQQAQLSTYRPPTMFEELIESVTWILDSPRRWWFGE